MRNLYRAIPALATFAALVAGDRAYAGEAETAAVLTELFKEQPKHPLRAIYEPLSFAPLWSGDRARGRAAAKLFRKIADADREGLNVHDYALDEIHDMALAGAHGFTPAELARLDLALTDVFVQYAGDQLFGRVAANAFYPRKLRESDRAYLANILIGAAARGDPEAAVDVVYPFSPDYPVLVAALDHYRELADKGGWAKVPAAITKLKKGGADPSVVALRMRLIASGDLSSASSTIAMDRYDDAVEEAVRAFQLRHAIDPDGAIGQGTLRELNISAAERAKLIELNLERRRSTGRGFDGRYILVNIPTFTLRAVEDKQTKIITRVIVGKRQHETPIVETRVTAIEFNPDWNVPKNIRNQEVIPEAQKDPSWLTDRGIRVLTGKGEDVVEVDPTSVDWSHAESEDFRFQQPPGPGNALGQLKLVTPNPFDIYLHDTPQRYLFKRPVRAFSHGCVRVDDPLQLSAWVLDDSEWTEPTIDRELRSTNSRTIKVKNPPQVYLVYWTVWADADGALRFAPDVYGWDAKLARALDRMSRDHAGEGSRVVSTAQDALRSTRSATLPSRM